MAENGRGVFHPNVLSLESLKLEDDVPRVQPTPQSIDYEVAPQSNLLQYVDHAGYKTALGSEVEAIGELEKVLEFGRMHVNVLYTFRSVSRAIPMVSGSGDPNKTALHMNTFKVLRPEMKKLTAIMEFYESAVQVFCAHVQTLTKRGKKQVVPEGLYDALIAVVDLMQKMDYLKDTKACLTNDFSRYKRALTSVRQDLPDAESLGQEQHSLQLFLGNPKHPKQLIINTLRDSIKAIPGHLEVLMKMLSLAVERLETNRYMTPDEKYRNIRVVPHLLWLLDGDVGAAGPDGSYNVFKQRKIKLQPLQRICQRYPVVPQCGDIAIKLSYVLERCPHFDADSSGAWFADAAAAQDYSVMAKWGKMTRDFDEYTTRLSISLNDIGTGPFVKTPANVRIAARVSRLVMVGLRLLQRWSCVVLECMAWKHTHPCSQAAFKRAGGDAMGKGMEYERVVRYNWSPNELSAIVEVITMTKSLGSLLSRAEGRLAPLLRLHVHAATQQMSQGDLVPVLHRADKKKRDIVTHLLQLRSMVSDWSDGVAPSEDYKKYKRAQGRVEAKGAPRRVVGPSSTQLQLVRAMVRAIYDENSELRQSSGVLGREDLKKEDLGLLRTYYEQSFGFPYLLDLGGTIRSSTDLGDLWYREYHLELTKEIQFPIEMSFPWIITEHIVKTKRAMAIGSASGDGPGPGGVGGGEGRGSAGKGAGIAGDPDSSMTGYGGGGGGGKKRKKKGKGGSGGEMGHVLVEEVLWALDVYNDAAHRALYVLNSQYLFNEIQAEVNLVFKQLLFDLEAEVFGYFKDWAASTVLDKAFKKVYEIRRGLGHFIPGRRRYETPVQQRHVQLLGRSVDLSHRVSGAMNVKIGEDLELALRRFESGGLSGIVELEVSIESAKKTHLLIQQAGLGVDSFSSLWGEANEVVSPASCRGRVVAHVVKVLVLDLFVNYRYCAATRRMVKSPVELKPTKYPQPPSTLDKNLGGGRLCGKAFEQMFSVGRGFVGGTHLSAMVRLLGHTDLPLVVETIIEHMRQKMLDIKDWTDALKGGLPPVKLPKYVFGTAGCYSFMEEKLRPILEYEDLKAGVFQDFRELGNALAFLQCLSEASSGLDCLKFVQTVPVMGLSSSKKWDPKRTRLVAATTALIRGADFTGEAGASLSGLEDAVLEGQAACKGLATSASIFRHTLGELSTALDVLRLREAWAGAQPANGVLDVEESVSFSRLFSALNFLFCMPEAKGEARVTDAVQFGDGFGLAGAVIMHLLGQRHQFELLDFSYHVLNVNNFERAGSKDGETGLNVEPAKARETEAFLHEAHREFCLMFDAFSVAEAVLPSRPTDQAAEVRIFHPPKDDTKINRALLVDKGDIWETQDVLGDRQAEAAAKKVRRPSAAKTTPTKSSFLRRSSKEKSYVPTEADRVEADNRKKKLTNFTVAVQAFMDGGEDETKPTAASALPAPAPIDPLSTPAGLSPTPSSIDVLKAAAAAAAGGGGGATRAKPPAAAPPPPGSATFPSPGDRKSVPGRPPPPSAQAAMPGSRPLSSQGMIMPPLAAGRERPLRAKSMSPPPVSFSKLNDATEAGRNGLEKREPRSSSQDRGGVARKKSSGSLPPGADKIMDMGFSARKARAALERSDGDVDQAVEWLLNHPSAPDEDSGDEDPGDEPRPPSPSSASPPPGRKSLPPKKAKPLKPQNPVFDQQAFTPVLIPAKPGAIVVASGPNAWTPPGGAGGGSSGGGGGAGAGGAGSTALTLVAPLSAPGPPPQGPPLQGPPLQGPPPQGPPPQGPPPQGPPLQGPPLQGPPPQGPPQGGGGGSGLSRPRSTPSIISALDPDSVDTFEPQVAPLPRQASQSPPPQRQGPQKQQQQQQQQQQQGPPSHLGSPVPAAVAAAGGYRRQSAPTGLSHVNVNLGGGMPPPRGVPSQQQQQQQQQGAQQPQRSTSASPPSLGPILGSASPPQLRPQLQQQQQPRPSNSGLGTNPGPARPPPPSGPAAVGGSTARGPARTPVPSGRAAVGGGGSVVGGGSSAGRSLVLAGGSSPALVAGGPAQQQQQQQQPRPQFQQGPMMPSQQQQGRPAMQPATQQQKQQQQQQQARPMMQGGLGMQGTQQGRGPPQQQMAVGSAGSMSMTAGTQSGMASQQQQFSGQNRGVGMIGARGPTITGGQAPRGMGMAMNAGGQQQMVGRPTGMQPRPQVLQPQQQQQPRPQGQARPQQFMQQQQPRAIPTLQPTPAQQQQQQIRPVMQGGLGMQGGQQARGAPQQFSGQQLARPQGQVRPQQFQQGQGGMQGQQQQQQQQQGRQFQPAQQVARGVQGMAAGGMMQQGVQQQGVQQQGMAQNGRPMVGAAPRPQQQQQQPQQRMSMNGVQQPMQMQQGMQGPRGNMAQAQQQQQPAGGGQMTPQQQQQLWQQQQLRQQQQQQQQQQQRQQGFNPRG